MIPVLVEIYSLGKTMRITLLLLVLASGSSSAETGYVYSGDLNGDGILDSIMSGPSEMFGNGGGPFIVSLSDGAGGFLQKEVGLHPHAVALERTPGLSRLWSYSRMSCCEGALLVTTLDEGFETQSIRLHFGASFETPTLSQEIYNSIFADDHRINFEVVDDYQLPPAPGGEWGK